MFGEMKELSLKMINASSPYDVMMVDSNTYRFVTDYGVEIAISFDLDDLLEHWNIARHTCLILRM